MPDEDKYICPNCGRKRFQIIFDTLNKCGAGIQDDIVQIECECGLKTSFDWSKVRENLTKE